MLNGKDLIISLDGVNIAASKSCSVDISAETKPVSSATDSEWEHHIPGRKSWQVQTSYLVPNVLTAYPTIEVYSSPWTMHDSGASFVRASGITRYGTVTRGLQVWQVVHSGTVTDITSVGTYDTANSSTAVQDMIDALTALESTNAVIAVTSADAWNMPATLQEYLRDTWHIPNIPVLTSGDIGAIAMVGGYNSDSIGICSTGTVRAGAAHVRASIVEDTVQSLETVVTNLLKKAGVQFTLRMQVDGYGEDYMTGVATCTNAKISSAVNSLIQGSFTFKGTGPLE